MTEKRLQILLVEDDEVEAEYMLRILQRSVTPVSVIVAQNGVEALTLLAANGNASRTDPSWLILTDIHMPQMNGLEFLRALRAQPALRRLIVYVLTSSNLDSDKNAAYDAQAAGYIVKANLEQQLPSFLRLLDAYQRVNEFPFGYEACRDSSRE